MDPADLGITCPQHRNYERNCTRCSRNLAIQALILNGRLNVFGSQDINNNTMAANNANIPNNEVTRPALSFDHLRVLVGAFNTACAPVQGRSFPVPSRGKNVETRAMPFASYQGVTAGTDGAPPGFIRINRNNNAIATSSSGSAGSSGSNASAGQLNGTTGESNGIECYEEAIRFLLNPVLDSDSDDENEVEENKEQQE